MFRSIGETLDKKEKNLIQAGKKSSDVSLVFDKFLNRYFAEYKNLFEWNASYDSKNCKIVINTGNKLIAGELSLRVKELSRLLREANLKVTQIIIV